MMKQQKEEKIKTVKQRNAVHLYLRLLSRRLNDAGLDMRKVLKPSIDIPWTEKSAKEYLWRPIQKAMFDKESFESLTSKEVTKVYEVLNRHLGEKFGVDEPFPSIEELMLGRLTDDNIN